MKHGHYKLSIKPTPTRKGLDILDEIGGCVLLVLVIYGGIFCMGLI